MRLLGSSSAAVAAGALRSIAYDADNKVKVAAAGAIPILVRLLGSSSAAVQEVAADTLWILAYNADNKNKVATAGAIPPLVQLLGSSSAVVQKAATRALWNIACNQATLTVVSELVGSGRVTAQTVLQTLAGFAKRKRTFGGCAPHRR